MLIVMLLYALGIGGCWWIAQPPACTVCCSKYTTTFRLFPGGPMIQGTFCADD